MQRYIDKFINYLKIEKNASKHTIINYTIDLDKRTILSDSCNVPAKEYVAIILLHYLARKTLLKGLPPPTGEWIDFKELDGGEGYYPAFKNAR